MVALLKLTGIAMIVIIVQSVNSTIDRIAPYIGVVAGDECAKAEAELQTKTTLFFFFLCVTHADAGTSTFAFPTFRSAEADAVFRALSISCDIRADEVATTLEVSTQLQLHIAHLEELMTAPMAMIMEREARIKCIVT